jgi:hypothetical protein
MSAEILRSKSTEHRWVVAIGSGYEPFEVKTVPEDGQARVRIGSGSTAGDADDLRAMAAALREAADTLDRGEHD